MECHSFNLGFKGSVSPVWNVLKVVLLDKPWQKHQALAILKMYCPLYFPQAFEVLKRLIPNPFEFAASIMKKWIVNC